MATEEQMTIARLGGGNPRMAYPVVVTMVAGATTTASYILPAGSRLSVLRLYVAASFTGTPTNIFLTIGKTAGAADYVAQVDVKASSVPTALTLVNVPDYVLWPSGQAIFVTLTANGGTSPAGSVTIAVDFAPPNY